MNTQDKIKKFLRAAPQPAAPETLYNELKKNVTAHVVKERRGFIHRWFAPSGGAISRWRVAAVIGIMVLMPLSYGATKLIKRFIAISQLPAVNVDWPGRGALSPDGRQFAGITWDSELAVIDTSTGQQRNLAEDCYGTVVWSADGSEIAVMKMSRDKEKGGLLAISPKTGETRSLARNLVHLEDWSRDGKLVLSVRKVRNRTVFSVILINLENEERTVLAEDTGVVWPFACFSPNSDLAIYVTIEDGRFILNLQRIDGTSHVKYSDFPGDISRLIWSPDGSHIVFTGTQEGISRQYKDLWAIRIQDSDFAGDAFPVVPDVEQVEFYNWAQNGQLAYRTGFQLGGIFTLPVSLQTGKATGAPRRVLRRSGLDSFCWSPDGKQIAVAQESEMDFIFAGSGQTIRNLPLIENVGRGMSWSPDGKWIAFCGVDRKERAGIFLIEADSGDIRLLVTYKKLAPNYDPTWSPDSKTIAYGHNNDIYVVKVEDGEPQRVTPPSENQRSKSANRPVFMPDGNSVAYLAGFEEKFGERILVTTLDGKVTREVFHLKNKEIGINIFDLSPDGRHVVFTPGNKEIWCAPTDGGEPFRIGDISNVGSRAWAWMPKWSPKGDAITFIVTCEEYQYWVMENFLPAAEAGGQ
jgi:Tol biopolymer transport system component